LCWGVNADLSERGKLGDAVEDALREVGAVLDGLFPEEHEGPFDPVDAWVKELEAGGLDFASQGPIHPAHAHGEDPHIIREDIQIQEGDQADLAGAGGF